MSSKRTITLNRKLEYENSYNYKIGKKEMILKLYTLDLSLIKKKDMMRKHIFSLDVIMKMEQNQLLLH